ncbi:MAG: aminotransferase, partial [Planctomycetaceae bacterium]|nr:aminotransferase [Planctomycetaceae bacterium]
MRSETDVPFEDKPFKVPVSDRVNRLPPYLFGKINKLKYEKRVAGIDVIDLGMRNPTDPPDPNVIEKMNET